LITEQIELFIREREEVRETRSETEAELETAVQAPLAGGIDPTETLPDELLWMILVRVLVGGFCGRVCRRWHAVCAGATAKKEAWQWRWAGYTHGKVVPRTLGGGPSPLVCMATGLNDTLYSGMQDGIIQVWCTATDLHIQALRGHTDAVNALVVGRDGTMYSASDDNTIRIWSGEDGTHLGTLAGHTHAVRCLAVGWDGTLYSGSIDKTVRVWTDRTDGSRLIRTLEGHTDIVWSLAASTNGKLYSSSADTTIRVWSAFDGSHLVTLEGHTSFVIAVAVATDDTVYTASIDGMLRVWSGRDGSPIRTVAVDSSVSTISIGAGKTVLIGDVRGRVSVWNGGAAPARTLYTFVPTRSPGATRVVAAVAIGQDGRLFVGSYNNVCAYAL
jgi:WD40 repeat protein